MVNNMLPIVDVELDESLVIKCPMVDFKNRRVSACKKCTNWAGVSMKCNDMTQSWENKFAIRCGFIMDRSVSKIEIIED
jgi:hypothetical protein